MTSGSWSSASAPILVASRLPINATMAPGSARAMARNTIPRVARVAVRHLRISICRPTVSYLTTKSGSDDYGTSGFIVPSFDRDKKFSSRSSPPSAENGFRAIGSYDQTSASRHGAERCRAGFAASVRFRAVSASAT